MYTKDVGLNSPERTQKMIAVHDLDNFLPVSCIKAADGNISHVICTDKRTGTDSIFTMAEIEEVFGKFSAIHFLTGEYPE